MSEYWDVIIDRVTCAQ